MRIFHLLKTLSILVLALLIIQSCATPIKRIYKSPDKFNGKKIVVKGSVISSLELIDLCSFTIKDRSGKIMVVTENLLPLKNDKIKVHGVVDRNYHYKEQNMIVIKEEKMKMQKMKDARKKIQKI
jgi:hypothetical protein